MATNAILFNLGLERFKDRQEERVRELVQGVGVYALKNLVMGTRVDTSRARSNWQVTLGSPAEGFDEDARDLSGQATISKGLSDIATADGKKVLWIHNGVPYISVLEELDGMLRGTVEAARTWLRSGGRLG